MSAAAGALVLGGCDLITACEADAVEERIRERLQAERAKWKAQGIDRYRLTYAQQIGSRRVDTVDVFVNDGTVDSIRTARETPRDSALVGTVASFFDRIEARIGEEESQFSASFDEERGFPTEYTADFQDRPSQTVITQSLVDRHGTSSAPPNQP